MNPGPAPIVLFVYNRPRHTRLTLESLQNNLLSDQSALFIYADGPAKDADENQLQKIKEVRDVVRSTKWCGEVHLMESATNKGLANSLISGITEVINKYGKAIILEDDMVTSKYFLKFMNDALNQYENNDNVACISGYVYPVKEKLPETFLLKGADCWGWATWKRAWDVFEANGNKLLDQLNEKKLTAEFDYNHSYPYAKMLQDQIAGKNDSWAIRWYASAFIKSKLTLYPGQSLVQNIGTDDSGFHFRNTDSYNVQLSNKPVAIEDIGIEENQAARKYFENYFRNPEGHSNFSKKIFQRTKSFIKTIFNQ